MHNPNTEYTDEEHDIATQVLRRIIKEVQLLERSIDTIGVNGFTINTYTGRLEYIRQNPAIFPNLFRAIGLPQRPRPPKEVAAAAPPENAQTNAVPSEDTTPRLTYPKDLL